MEPEIITEAQTWLVNNQGLIIEYAVNIAAALLTLLATGSSTLAAQQRPRTAVAAPSVYEVVSNMPARWRDVQGAVTRWQFAPRRWRPSRDRAAHPRH